MFGYICSGFSVDSREGFKYQKSMEIIYFDILEQ